MPRRGSSKLAGYAPPRGLYVHVPFCEKLCPYCDFNKYLLRDGGVDGYLDSLEREIALYGPDVVAGGRTTQEQVADGHGTDDAGEVMFDTVFIGGGTPTALTADQLERLLDAIMTGFRIAADAEVTIEANPGTLTDKKLAALKRGGVNRLSLGVQSLNDDLLRTLGRIHTARQARECYERARNVGFDNVSLDLMFGLPGQDAADWRKTLTDVVRWGPQHLSCYGLIIEEGTPFGELYARGELPLPGDEQELAMYEFTIDHLGQHGYEHYEIANWAVPGRQSRHNRIYWRNGEWLGLGPGAHSQWGGERFANVRLPADYARLTESGRVPVESRERVDERTAQEDTVILGLRLRDGVDADEFERRFGVAVTDVFDAEIERVRSLGLVESHNGRLRLTRRGLYLSNQVFQEFIRS